MSKITVTFKDGTEKTFKDDRRGGSYVNSVKYEGMFAIVQDVWGNKYCYPATDIREIHIPSNGGHW